VLREHYLARELIAVQVFLALLNCQVGDASQVYRQIIESLLALGATVGGDY
jgi:hypothetical protein